VAHASAARVAAETARVKAGDGDVEGARAERSKAAAEYAAAEGGGIDADAKVRV
jgi:hypothetical protein